MHLLPEVFMGQIQIHIVGIGPVLASKGLSRWKRLYQRYEQECILVKPRTLSSVYAVQEICESWSRSATPTTLPSSRVKDEASSSKLIQEPHGTYCHQHQG
ncbi:hypothetical protein B9Z19DRAFT_1076654 [Tuber borchii]|uniref:Uncharacterized protein n=1 Tax=Tuber borchii TaxID=42251 RepID=A0A2T7A1N0_TUBBO|nr:hypothetical protein B9Z19DRAFT_1076654 [Tuber borchii]